MAAGSHLFHRAEAPELAPAPASLHFDQESWVLRLDQALQGIGTAPSPSGLLMLDIAGMPESLLEALRKLVAGGADESAVVVTFLQELAQSEVGQPLGRAARRVIAKLSSKQPADHALIEQIRQALALVYVAPNAHQP